MGKILFLNGSPKKMGTIAALLSAVAVGARGRRQVERVNIYDLKMRPCTACMKCRTVGECVLPRDDAHLAGQMI